MDKLIYLTQGLVTVVSEERYNKLIEMGLWYAIKAPNTFYAVKKSKSINGKRKIISIHQEIIKMMGLKIPEGYEIDHKDRDGLNNRDSNLRVVTYSTNTLNQKLYGSNTSGIKGVDKRFDRDLYRMHYSENGKRLIKYFNTFEEAVEARLQWEKEQGI